jgi:hypothetical protein
MKAFPAHNGRLRSSASTVCPASASSSPVALAVRWNSLAMVMPADGGLTDTPTRIGSGSAISASAGSAAMTASMSAASATDVASGPFSARPPQLPSPMSAGTTPAPGLIPKRPQLAAGMRIEPPPSFPCAIGTMPDATAAAEPPDEPPAVRRVSHGLRVTP